MSISYKEATELLSALQEIEIPKNNLSKTTPSTEEKAKIPIDNPSFDNVMNVSAFSLDRCDSQELIHCYKLALDFGVPTARRALAMYQSKSNFDQKSDQEMDVYDKS